MSLLAIQLPPRPRLGSRASGTETPAPVVAPTQWVYSFSADGQRAGPLARATAALLPVADQVVLVLDAADVSWHRVRLPKAPAARMRAALLGLLEEQLLEEAETVHLALANNAGAGGGSKSAKTARGANNGEGAGEGANGGAKAHANANANANTTDGKAASSTKNSGPEAWVAATHAPYLLAALTALQTAGLQVAHVASALPAPGDGVRGHFANTDAAAVPDPTPTTPAALGARSKDADFFADTTPAALDTLLWSLSTHSGAWHLPLLDDAGISPSGSAPISSLALALRHTLPPAAPGQHWTATPQAAAAAQQFLGRAVPVQTAAARLLEAAHSPTNLRQFDLAPRHRGFAKLGLWLQRLRSHEWRTARLGLIALLGLHVVALNAAAWSHQQSVHKRRAAVEQLLRSTYPGVQTVLDAPLQMRAETDRLRTAAGRPGPADLETALAQAAAAWPANKPAIAALRFEGRTLTLSSPGWTDDEVAALRARLQTAEWAVVQTNGLITLTRKGSR